MSKSRISKWVIGVLELLIGLSLLGEPIAFGFFWIPVLALLGLHVISLFLSKEVSGLTRGNIFGIITAFVSWVPLLRNIMRIVTAIFVFYEAMTPEERLPHNLINK
ncbi:hypothetical protein PRVXT_002923 [Proteinivorax tanatarense]|uniref:Uncharacterized protein n=1 Tax=Proteinivorax tanatarense TaxID=1260629 RepID=A0AAU7VLX7_9FIRM